MCDRFIKFFWCWFVHCLHFPIVARSKWLSCRFVFDSNPISFIPASKHTHLFSLELHRPRISIFIFNLITMNKRVHLISRFYSNFSQILLKMNHRNHTISIVFFFNLILSRAQFGPNSLLEQEKHTHRDNWMELISNL